MIMSSSRAVIHGCASATNSLCGTRGSTRAPWRPNRWLGHPTATRSLLTNKKNQPTVYQETCWTFSQALSYTLFPQNQSKTRVFGAVFPELAQPSLEVSVTSTAKTLGGRPARCPSCRCPLCLCSRLHRHSAVQRMVGQGIQRETAQPGSWTQV